MSNEQITAICALIASVLSFLGIVYLAGVKIARLELQVNTIWDFLMRRALGESVQKGLGTMNSPITFNEDAKKLFNSMSSDLKNFYKTLSKNLSHSELLQRLERNFGDKILREICIPNNLTHGSCLLIALSVASEP